MLHATLKGLGSLRRTPLRGHACTTALTAFAAARRTFQLVSSSSLYPSSDSLYRARVSVCLVQHSRQRPCTMLTGLSRRGMQPHACSGVWTTRPVHQGLLDTHNLQDLATVRPSQVYL